MKNILDKKGVAMLAGLAILLVLFLLTASILLLSIKRKQTATYRINQIKALSLAEAGATQALLDLERAADIDDDNDGTPDDSSNPNANDDGDRFLNGTDPDIDGDGIPETHLTHPDNNNGTIGLTALGLGSYSVSTNIDPTTPANSSVTYYTITSTAHYPSASAISRVTRRIEVHARRIPEAFNRHLIYANSLAVAGGITARINGNIYTPEATGRALTGNYTETDITLQTIVLRGLNLFPDYRTAAGSNTYGNGSANLTFMGSNFPFTNDGIHYFNLGSGRMVIGDNTGTNNATTIYGTLVIDGTGTGAVIIHGLTTIIPYQITLSDGRHYTLPAIISNVPITCITTNGNIEISGLIYLDPSIETNNFTVSGVVATSGILTINGALVAHNITIDRDTTINYDEGIFRFPPPYFNDTTNNQQTVVLDRGWEGWQLLQ